MDSTKKSRISRNLLFWLSGGKITDPDKVLAQIALDTDSTPEEVWEVYTELVQAAFYTE